MPHPHSQTSSEAFIVLDASFSALPTASLLTRIAGNGSTPSRTTCISPNSAVVWRLLFLAVAVGLAHQRRHMLKSPPLLRLELTHCRLLRADAAIVRINGRELRLGGGDARMPYIDGS